MSSSPADRTYAFGNWLIDCQRRELRHDNVTVPIGSRAFEILKKLAGSAGLLVTKDELIGSVWSGLAIEDNTLQVHISAVRKALGKDRDLLKTVSGRGYTLAGSWRSGHPDQSAAAMVSTPADSSFSSNLPNTRAPLIGREDCLSELAGLLSAYRAVTLVGPGGIGKTKLAIELARCVASTFDDSVALIELATLQDPALATSATARTLRLALNDKDVSAAGIAQAIGTRRLLLILDNCEHVIDAAAQIASAVLRYCPNVTVLATSREGLRIDGEYVATIPPLSVPRTDVRDPDLLLRESAVQLFVARTRASRAGFVPGAEDLSKIAAVCRRLDGIPLALEFAAARAANLGVDTVLLRLDRRFELLSSGRRDQLPRHQTLRATLDWSYDLLSPEEQRLLCWLAVAPAGFTLDAAIAMMDDVLSRADVIEILFNLVGKSLVSLDPSFEGRWRLLETTRAYALEKLAEAGFVEQAARRHAGFLRQLVAPLGGTSPASDEISRLAQEIGNVHAALDWAFAPGGDAALGIELTSGFVPVWMQLLSFVECSTRIEHALAHLSPELPCGPRLKAQLHVALGFALLNTTGTADRMKAALNIGLVLAEELSDLELQLKAVWTLWSYNLNSGQYDAAKDVGERYLAIALRTENPANETVGRRLIGAATHFYGAQEDARRELTLSLDHSAHGLTDGPNQMWFLLNQSVLAKAMLARVLLLQGKVAPSRSLAAECLQDAQREKDKLAIAYALRNAVCPIALMTHDLAGADQAISSLLELVTREGIAFWTSWTSCLKGQLLVLQSRHHEGVALLRSGLKARAENGWLMRNPEFLGTLAEGLLATGETAQALAAVENALNISRQGKQLWCLADLLRIKGEILLADTPLDLSRSELLFAEGLSVAREQQCRFYELKVAAAWARIMAGSDRQQTALDLVGPVSALFDREIDLPALAFARGLIASPGISVTTCAGDQPASCTCH
ncbi:transcriptional regulator [Bradyrhizobium cajani]|uniref:Transcriptional regulator n=1 Tax=Bradyrhizobium cajani TaxID=1928661 RepID=A0A844T9V5_9BRAD|nr:winged helix-turn-helix domain-containing protein [Bradyrhizobium cajani]MVT71871.1 transcriptional regulator [Bradyrhizobium cajani]